MMCAGPWEAHVGLTWDFKPACSWEGKSSWLGRLLV